MLAVVDQLQRGAEEQPAAYDALDEHYKAALRMITAPETKQAFAVEAEDPKLRDRYGRNRFGQSCLLPGGWWRRGSASSPSPTAAGTRTRRTSRR